MKRTIIDLRAKPKNFRGEDIGDLTLGQLCAEVVIGMGAHKNNVIKLFTIAQELYQKGEVELDAEDTKLLRSTVEGCDKIVLMAKAQMLMAIDEAQPC